MMDYSDKLSHALNKQDPSHTYQCKKINKIYEIYIFKQNTKIAQKKITLSDINTAFEENDKSKINTILSKIIIRPGAK